MKEYLRKVLVDRNIEMQGEEAYDSFKTQKDILYIRDIMYRIGKIIVEDIENKIYIATVKTGCLDLNEAVVAIRIEANEVYVYSIANEGIINQHSAEKAIRRIRKELVYEG